MLAILFVRSKPIAQELPAGSMRKGTGTVSRTASGDMNVTQNPHRGILPAWHFPLLHLLTMFDIADFI
jgi:hypothetical protein